MPAEVRRERQLGFVQLANASLREKSTTLGQVGKLLKMTVSSSDGCVQAERMVFSLRFSQKLPGSSFTFLIPCKVAGHPKAG